jgi:glycosyltransferase involved in cell wall biosynthesis
MNILQVTLGFYPAQTWGGPANVVYQNGKELVRRGHRITIYCTNLLNKKQKMGNETSEATVDGMRVVYFNTFHFRWWPGTLGPFWTPSLPSFLHREIKSFDIVHLNGYRSVMMLTVARAAQRSGVPIISQPHGTLPVIVNSFFAKRVYDRLFGHKELEDISALIALQNTEMQQAKALGIPNDRIVIIPNGIDPKKHDTAPEEGSFRRRFGLDMKKPMILFLGRISKVKGPDMLVEAFAKMKNVEAQLVIAGPDDGQLADVQKIIKSLSLEKKVFLTGLLRGSDVLSSLRDATLFVLPSRYDAFPCAVLEACMMGTPMVITDRCELSDLVQDRIADVVPFDSDAFALAMERLLRDDARYQRYRANSRDLLEKNFSIRSVVDRLETVYHKAVREKDEKM